MVVLTKNNFGLNLFVYLLLFFFPIFFFPKQQNNSIFSRVILVENIPYLLLSFQKETVIIKSNRKENDAEIRHFSKGLVRLFRKTILCGRCGSNLAKIICVFAQRQMQWFVSLSCRYCGRVQDIIDFVFQGQQDGPLLPRKEY